MSEHDAIAKKLVDDVRKRCDDLLTLPDEWSELEDLIAAALASERAKFAPFADDRGEPRKVLGTLPVTADGYFYGQGADLWYVLPKGSATEAVCMTHSPYTEAYQPAYSSRKAATSALDAAKEKP